MLPARLHGLRAGAEGSLGQCPNVHEAGERILKKNNNTYRLQIY